jgi:hypothetical protein
MATYSQKLKDLMKKKTYNLLILKTSNLTKMHIKLTTESHCRSIFACPHGKAGGSFSVTSNLDNG